MQNGPSQNDPADRATVLSGVAHQTAPTSELREELQEGGYEIGSEIARGGMGRILTTLQKSLRRNVALKVLLNPANEEYQRRFIREARITGGLQHPSIAPIHELNVDERGRLFYTMKLVQGVTLLRVLRDVAQDNLDAASGYTLPGLLTIFQKICDAVAFAHAQAEPIIHRDLKPENIMVGDYGEVLVLDWGAAKILYRGGAAESSELADEENSSISEALVTRAGRVMGTPGYMAPEQARGDAAAADERTDIYALGAILYAILTLQAPRSLTETEAHDFETRSIRGEDTKESFRASVTPLLGRRSARPRLDHLPGRNVPDSLVAVVLKAMALLPKDRFATVKELQADVAAYQAGFATSAEEARAWRRFKLLVRRNKALFSAVAATFVILLAATLISLHQRHLVLESNQALQATLQSASFADLEAARQSFRKGAWREGVILLGRSLTFWPDNREAANYLLSAIVFGRGDMDKLPIFGVPYDAEVGDVAFSPDGRYFATPASDHYVRIWDVTTGAQVGKALHHDGSSASTFSPDGKQLLVLGGPPDDGSALLYDLRSGRPITELRHGRPDLDPWSQVASGVFSRDGSKILTSSFDHTARLWEAASGREIVQLLNPGRVHKAVFSPDESRILTSYRGGGAMLWDASTFKPIGVAMEHQGDVRRSLFSPDGNKIVTCSLDATARMWDGWTGQPLTAPLQHNDYVWDIAMDPTGKLFATASYDTARLWSLADGTQVGVQMKHNGPIRSISFSSDGKRLLTGSADKTVCLWDTNGRLVGTPLTQGDAADAIFSPDATKILTVGDNNVAYVWDAAPPAAPGEILPIPGEVLSIEFTGNDDVFFVATREGKAGPWSLSEKQFVPGSVQQSGRIVAASYHAPTQRFATAATDGAVIFYNATNGREIGRTQSTNQDLLSLAFSTDGNSLFAAYLDGTVLHWKVPQGTLIGQEIRNPAKIDAFAVSPSGTEIATGSRDNVVRFWDAKTGNRLPREIKLENRILTIAYHPDGKSIATSCDDHTARISSLDGAGPGEPFMLNGRATAIRYTNGGNALLVGGADNTEGTCYDTKTHSPTFLPLAHPTGISHISSNASGSLVVTVTNDGVARLWRIPSTNEPPPKWLSDYLRTLSGLTFSREQQLESVTMRERIALRKSLLDRRPESSIWDLVMRQSFEAEVSHSVKR